MNEKSAPITPLADIGKAKEDLTATQPVVPSKRPNDVLAAIEDDSSED